RWWMNHLTNLHMSQLHCLRGGVTRKSGTVSTKSKVGGRRLKKNSTAIDRWLQRMADGVFSSRLGEMSYLEKRQLLNRNQQSQITQTEKLTHFLEYPEDFSKYIDDSSSEDSVESSTKPTIQS